MTGSAAQIVSLHECTMTVDEALDEFQLELRANGYAPRTIDDYGCHVRRFFGRHHEAWSKHKATRRYVLTYVGEDGLAPAGAVTVVQAFP